MVWIGLIDWNNRDVNSYCRDGANNGFHEAIGELMALAGATPKYLNSIGLIPNDEFKEEDPETDVNFLMSQVIRNLFTILSIFIIC